MSTVNALRFRNTPKLTERFESPKRDDSGMDVDQTFGSYSGSPYHREEGPSRKRHHGENGATPFQPSPFVSRPTQYNNNAPFLFNTSQPLPPQAPPLPPFSQYDPNTLRFDMATLNTLPPAKPALWAAEIEMEDAYNKPSPRRSHGPAVEAAAAKPSDAPVDPPKSAEPAETAVVEKQASVQDEPEEERPIARGAVSRVRKRREREWKKRYDTDTEGEEEHSRRSSERAPSKTERTVHHNYNLNAPGMRHSEIPALLLGYLQFFVNASIVVFVLYLVAMFILTVRRDVQDRMSEASIELMQEISECTQLYLANRCDPAVRVPAMENACKTWDICMHRDPTMIGRTNVMAETFAGVINAFVEQISWKTMGFTLVTLSFMVTLANSALFNLRQSASHVPVDTAPPPFYPPSQGHLGWQQYGQFPGQSMPSIGAMQGQGGQTGLGTGADGTRQIGWEEPKKKGWLW